MVFSSLTFLIFFMPLCALAYFLCGNRVYRNTVLLVFSLLFYSWGEPKSIVLIVLAAVEAYFGGLAISRLDGTKWKKPVFIAAVTLITGNLVVFKYLNFAVDTAEALTGLDFAFKEIALPIGISFYTFQILSYIIDLYRGEIALQRNPFYLMLYVTFFPQLIAGPIVRYKTIEEEITLRSESLSEAAAGCRRFITGLAKKVIIANNVAKVAEIVYSSSVEEYGTLMFWIAALAYTFQIYFDFSGYSDMAIGLGRIFGFHFMENFDYPYTADSITDFWRRWHISLSRWFRDYIYIPLGGGRTTRLKWVRNILVVWSLTGLWHGADWNFVIWGLYFAALLVLEKLLLSKVLERLPRFVRWLYTFALVNVSWVIFNLTDISQMLRALGMMLCYRHTDVLGVILADPSIMNAALYLPLAFVFSFPVAKVVGRRFRIPELLRNLACLALLALSMAYIASSSFNPFIYFRF